MFKNIDEIPAEIKSEIEVAALQAVMLFTNCRFTWANSQSPDNIPTFNEIVNTYENLLLDCAKQRGVSSYAETGRLVVTIQETDEGRAHEIHFLFSTGYSVLKKERR